MRSKTTPAACRRRHKTRLLLLLALGLAPILNGCLLSSLMGQGGAASKAPKAPKAPQMPKFESRTDWLRQGVAQGFGTLDDYGEIRGTFQHGILEEAWQQREDQRAEDARVQSVDDPFPEPYSGIGPSDPMQDRDGAPLEDSPYDSQVLS